MFWLKKKKQILDEVYFRSVCITVRETLESILKTEYKLPTASGGNSTIDYQTTCRMMKTQARIALDLLENIKKTDKKENRYE